MHVKCLINDISSANTINIVTIYRVVKGSPVTGEDVQYEKGTPTITTEENSLLQRLRLSCC